MDRLFSALVLGIYLASCAPALPPAGSAAGGRIDGRGAGRASSAGRSAAAKSVLPDLAREERLVKAWQSKTGTWHGALERALQEQIPEMYSSTEKRLWESDVRTLYPAPGFDPKNMWGNTTPHTYVYQVNRGSVIVPEGEHKGKSFYDVRQVGFLFSKVEERERTDTAYISKAELLAPYFALCFGEKAMQRQAGNFDLDYSLYPLVKRFLDKGLKPADYVDYETYEYLYVDERMAEPPPIGAGEQDAYWRIGRYKNQASMEHREYLKQYELYAADTKSPLEPGETQLHREYIAGQGINFVSPDFTARLNSFSVRKNAYENVGDVIDGYWEALADSGAFGRAFRRAVQNLDAYLAARNVDTDVNLPTYFKIRHNISVYRCYAPRLAVCGAAQALSLGWLQVPVVAVELNAGSACWLDVPRITGADSNKLGISGASFETGRGNGQRGFSGYEDGGGYKHALNAPGRPDKFSMGALEIHSPEHLKQKGAKAFAEAYYQCNYPYKLFSRAALKGMTQVEAARVMTNTCGDSIPEYWLNLFHGEEDDRITTITFVKAIIIISIIINIVASAYSIAQMYQAYLLAQAMAASGVVAGVETLSASGGEGVVWEFSAEWLSSSGSEGALSSSGWIEGVMTAEEIEAWELAQMAELDAMVAEVAAKPKTYILPGGIIYAGKAKVFNVATMPVPEGFTLVVWNKHVFFVPEWILSDNAYVLKLGLTANALLQVNGTTMVLEIPIIASDSIVPWVLANLIGEMLTPVLPLVFF